MDLGWLDMGCISVSDKLSAETVPDSDRKDCDASEKVTSASKVGKNKSPRGPSQSTLNVLNKFTSQIKKPSHRKSSHLNWFPRKKVDSYLQRKIKMLQEVDGTILTLDETLGDSNPHYSRVLREKIAAREAAHKAMEARKAALVEASWCRILKAARIPSKEAEAQLLIAEKTAAEAFEAAASMGVIMYDKPNCPRVPSQVRTSTVNGGRSTTHTVTASFETAFDVDKEVATAVKSAFIRLANCSSFNKDEFKDLLRKISQNPDMEDNDPELSEFSSECESESGTSQNDVFISSDMDMNVSKIDGTSQKKYRRRYSFEKFNVANLEDMMLERLKCLTEDELSSLATIVATCGLNAALAEVESSNLHDPGSASYTSRRDLNFSQRMSSLGAAATRHSNVEHFMDGQMKKRQDESELPSLDKYLVQHMSKLEREVQEAKDSRRNESRDKEKMQINNAGKVKDASENIPDLGSILVKHSSRFEKEIEEAKKHSGRNFEIACKNSSSYFTSSEAIPDLGNVLIQRSSKLENEVEVRRNIGKANGMNGSELQKPPFGLMNQRKENVPEIPSLDKFLVKHVSRLEKEVQEAKNRANGPSKGRETSEKKADPATTVLESEKSASSVVEGDPEKENINLNEKDDRNFDIDKKESTINLPLPHTGENAGESLRHFEQESLNVEDAPLPHDMKAGYNEKEDSLDKILIKPVHRLEREKMQAMSLGSSYGRRKDGGNAATDYEGLDKVLVKHVSRLEKEKMELRSAEEELKVKRNSRNKHLPMNEEGSLDQILVKHKSRLEREKMASAQQPGDQIRQSVSRRQARERELQEAWGGLTLGNSIKPHLSKLEREKAAWIKAEEEERRRAMEEL